MRQTFNHLCQKQLKRVITQIFPSFEQNKLSALTEWPRRHGNLSEGAKCPVSLWKGMIDGVLICIFY